MKCDAIFFVVVGFVAPLDFSANSFILVEFLLI